MSQIMLSRDSALDALRKGFDISPNLGPKEIIGEFIAFGCDNSNNLDDIARYLTQAEENITTKPTVRRRIDISTEDTERLEALRRWAKTRAEILDHRRAPSIAFEACLLRALTVAETPQGAEQLTARLKAR